MVKHPSTWMKRMCKTSYRLSWKHSGAHCPNLVEISGTNSSTVPVPVTLNGYDWQLTNPSLVHVWNRWNQEYVYYDKNDDFLRLIIRFEDYIFHNRKVLEEIARCVGSPIEPNQTLKLKKETAKQHGTKSGLLQVIIKYGNTGGSNDPTNNMTYQDVEYYKEHLDKNLMKILHYQQM